MFKVFKLALCQKKRKKSSFLAEIISFGLTLFSVKEDLGLISNGSLKAALSRVGSIELFPEINLRQQKVPEIGGSSCLCWDE